MEPEGSLPHVQVLATWRYPEQDQFNPRPPQPTSWKSILILSSRLFLSSGLFSSDFPTKTPYTTFLFPIRATSPVHHILLDLITRTILDEGYRSLCSLLCSFLYSSVTSSLLGPNIFLGVLFWNSLKLLFSLNVSNQVSNPYKKRHVYVHVCVWPTVNVIDVCSGFLFSELFSVHSTHYLSLFHYTKRKNVQPSSRSVYVTV